jgi:hypothetical protein
MVMIIGASLKGRLHGSTSSRDTSQESSLSWYMAFNSKVNVAYQVLGVSSITCRTLVVLNGSILTKLAADLLVGELIEALSTTLHPPST